MNESENTDRSEIELHEDIQNISSQKQAFYVGIIWALWFFSLYTAVFISWYGTLIPFAIAQLLYVRWIRKKGLHSVPLWVRKTRFYDRFVRQVTGKKSLRSFRSLGLLLLGLGLIQMVSVINDPTISLDDMIFVHGVFQKAVRLGIKNPCGDMILTFRLDDGKSMKFFSAMPRNRLHELKDIKEEQFSLWATTDHSIIPQCREFPMLRQIKGNFFQDLYDQDRVQRLYQFRWMLSIFLLVVGGAVLLRILYRAEI